MKKISAIVILSIFAMLSLSSCQKEYIATPSPDPSSPIANPFKGTFTCKIGENAFNAETKNVQLFEIEGIKSLNISATQYDYQKREGYFETITISIPNYAGSVRYQANSQATIVYTKVENNTVTANYTSTISDENYHVTLTGDYIGTFNTAVVNANNPSDKIVLSDGNFDIH